MYYCSGTLFSEQDFQIQARTRPELNFAPVPEPVPEPQVKSGTRLCHRFLIPIMKNVPIKLTLEYIHLYIHKSIWNYHENIPITYIRVNGPGNKIKSININ